MVSMTGNRKLRAVLLVALVLAVSALVVVAGCGSGKGGGLTYSFKAGDAYTYDLEIVMNGSMSAPDMAADEGTIPKDATVKARFSMKVTEVKDNVATIVYTYDSMEMIAEGQTETLPVDQLPQVTVKMDQYGKVLSVDGAAGGPLGGILGLSGSLPFDPSQMSGSALVGLPPSGKLAVGEEWTTTVEQPIPGFGQTVQATTKAKITSLTKEGDDQIAGIDFSLDVPLDLTIDLGALMGGLAQGASSESLPADFKFVMTMKGAETMSGTSTVNLSKGLPVALDADATMKFAFAISEAPEDMVPADERGPFEIDITMKVKLAQVK